MSNLTVQRKRELIYISQRFKEIAAELRSIRDEKRDLPKGNALSDLERRRRIYIVERIKRLMEEKDSLTKLRSNGDVV